MNCKGAQNLIDGYIDGELDPAGNLEVERHLEECALCSQGYQSHQALQRGISGGELRFKSPPDLQKRIQSSLRRAARAETAHRVVSRRWFSVAASMAAAALVVLTLVPLLKGRSADDLLAREVLASHVRSLMVNHLADVPSSDRHTVKPWFDGKLDFAPPVEDLAGSGFPLIGGRLDYIDNRPVAALVYQRRKHFINLFIWPSAHDPEADTKMTARQGYDLFSWTKSGMTYWAVSDLEQSELRNFVQLLQKGAAPAPQL